VEYLNIGGDSQKKWKLFNETMILQKKIYIFLNNHINSTSN